MAAPAPPKQRARGRGTPTPSSGRRLSEVAKRLVIPRDIVATDWPDVSETCRDKLGLEFDGWQDGAGQLLLAKRADGILAHTVGGFGMSICRQTGKTHFVSGGVFGLSVNRPGLLTIWSAHHSKTHMETFMAMQAFAARSRIAPFIDKVYTGSGDEEIRFRSGSRILFGARERGFGRGIPGVDILVSDEGQILSQRAMQNMLATMNTSELGLHIYAGTPPKPEDNSEVWLQMRDEALSGESVDLVWIEMGADDDADLDDQNQWRKANCSIPHRTPIHATMRLRKRLDDDGFRREALGIYDDNDGSVFDLTLWNRLGDTAVAAPDLVTLMVDVSPDRKWSSIGVAGEVEGERTIVMTESIKGTAGVVPRLKELMGIAGKEGEEIDEQSRDVIEVAIFGGGSARVLEPDLVKAGIEYEKLTASDMAAAYGNLQEMIKAKTVVHVEQPELNIALANTKTRFLQTGEAEAFDRRGQHVDISPAVAAAGALYRFGLLSDPMPILL